MAKDESNIESSSRKKKKEKHSTPITENTEAKLDHLDGVFEGSKIKSRKRKSEEATAASVEYAAENNCQDGNEVSNELHEIKKKKRKHKTAHNRSNQSDALSLDNGTLADNEPGNIPQDEATNALNKTKKKKHKKSIHNVEKHCDTFDLPDCKNEKTENTHESEMNETKKNKRKRNKNKNTSNVPDNADIVSITDKVPTEIGDNANPKGSLTRTVSNSGTVNETTNNKDKSFSSDILKNEISKKKKKKKKKSKIMPDESHANNRENINITPENIVDRKEKAGIYLTKWKHDKSNWKFAKAIQTWLIKNMFQEDRVSEQTFSVLLEYLVDLKGQSRVLAIGRAETVIAELEKDSTNENDELPVSYYRARSVLQYLQ